eukprot:3544293-Lingulodinium_polyedra.AAC.1
MAPVCPVAGGAPGAGGRAGAASCCAAAGSGLPPGTAGCAAGAAPAGLARSMRYRQQRPSKRARAKPPAEGLASAPSPTRHASTSAAQSASG